MFPEIKHREFCHFFVADANRSYSRNLAIEDLLQKKAAAAPEGEAAAGCRHLDSDASYWLGTSSTRRFCARPSAVSLVATKSVLPYPCAINWLDGIPSFTR